MQFNTFNSQNLVKKALISNEVNKILREMEVLGRRPRTIHDYRFHFTKLCEKSKITYCHELNRSTLINYLDDENISQQTKRIRLKSVRPILKALKENGLIETDFWANINIKVNEEIKKGISESELNALIGVLDFHSFIEFRDATMFLLMFETGARIQTIVSLESQMIDFDKLLINYAGSTMKNHRSLSLPISEDLAAMLNHLIQFNKELCQKYNKHSNTVFLTQKGLPMNSKAFSKRVKVYKDKYNFKNINPHAIRRGFAKRLLDKGVNIAIISKALNHSSLEVTTKYLYIENNELIDTLREFV